MAVQERLAESLMRGDVRPIGARHSFKIDTRIIAASNLPLLQVLGVGDAIHVRAGPELRRVTLLHGDRAVTADLPTSLVGQLALTAHVTVDFVLAIFLVAAPFLLGFSDESAPRNFFMILGVVLLLMTIGTRFRERTEQAAG